MGGRSSPCCTDLSPRPMSMPSAGPPTPSSPTARASARRSWPAWRGSSKPWPGRAASPGSETASSHCPARTSALRNRSGSFSVASPPSPQSGGNLLVVDDNRVNRLLIGRALEQLGHRVAFAENGREALEVLRQRPVDLVLLDIEMPEMNGYQVLEALAADPHLRDVPVVMMSSVEEVDSVARCIEMGAEDYLFKPVNPVLLRARIGSSLEKKRLRDQQRELVPEVRHRRGGGRT